MVKAQIGIGRISLRKAIPIFNRNAQFTIELTNAEKGVKKGRIIARGYIQAPEALVVDQEEEDISLSTAQRPASNVFRLGSTATGDLSVMAQFPVRLSIATYNVWGNKCWPERSPAFGQVFHNLKADIYLLQELTQEVGQFLESQLSDSHERATPGGVDDSCGIFWNKNLLTEIAHGCEGAASTKTAVHWARLRLTVPACGTSDTAAVTPPLRTVMICTAYLPFEDDLLELAAQQRQLCEHLRVAIETNRCENEAVIFGGSLAEDTRVWKLLKKELGMLDVFDQFNMLSPPTHPVRPLCDDADRGLPNRTVDRILFSTAAAATAAAADSASDSSAPPVAGCQVVGAFVKAVRGGVTPPPSNHLPAVALLELL